MLCVGFNDEAHKKNIKKIAEHYFLLLLVYLVSFTLSQASVYLHWSSSKESVRYIVNSFSEEFGSQRTENFCKILV